MALLRYKFYYVGGQPYSSKDMLYDHIEKIKSNTPTNQPIVGEDLDFLLDIFAFHPDWQYLSVGMKGVVVLPFDQSLELFIVYEDGRKKAQQISTHTSVRNMPTSIKRPIQSQAL